jgi:hypothetical protein
MNDSNLYLGDSMTVEQPTIGTGVPPGLRTDAPPETGEQILAWAIDVHGQGHKKPARYPRWVIVQFSGDWPEGERYWRWSFPGGTTRVEVLGWQLLTAMDRWGAYAAGRELPE